MPTLIDIHDLAAVERLRAALRIDPYRLKRLRVRFYKSGKSAARSLQELPEPAREPFAARVRFHQLTLEQAIDSQLDGATKLVFRTGDELALETVILRLESGRTALCVSCQIGCGAACRFCATGQLGIRRNLRSSEILDQIVQANKYLAGENRRVRNIVYMGMGEPFHNEAHVHEALGVLVHGECFHHAPARISVSTVGIPAAMKRFALLFPRVRLALSLHSARPATRQQLIPLANRYPLDRLHEAVATVTQLQDQPVMIEYLMLAGLTDGPAELAALDAWAASLRVHINLIPYNPITGADDLRPTAKPDREAFANELKARGHRVTLRYSLGADVTAACGQLVRRENQRDGAATCPPPVSNPGRPLAAPR